jgi:SAM-dependent methyltransferase
MTLSPSSELNLENKSAWDHLYASTPDLIWGREPIAFLPRCLPRAADLPAGAVLDAAAGEGRNLPVLLTLGRPLTACDSSAAALAKIPAALRERVTTLTCDLGGVPLPAASFAFILLSDVVETLPAPAPIMAELFRLLVPGGLLLTNIPSDDDGIAGVEMNPVSGGGWLYRGRYFYRFYNRREAEGLLTGAGFELVSDDVCSWLEAAHPHFREQSHQHRSQVLLVRRPG